MNETVLQISRFLVAANFLFFGLDGFFHFLPPPAQSAEMKKFVEAILATRIIFPTVKTIEVICGLLLFANLWTRLALFLLVPIVFGILCSQILFNLKKGYWITILTVVPYLILLVHDWTNLIQFLTDHSL